jgi:hypothetical protein
LALNDEAINRLAANLVKMEVSAERLSQEQLTKVIAEELYIFDLDKQRVAVSAKTFCTELNQRFVRRLPRSPADVRRAVEDQVVEQLDLGEARTLKIDQNWQFVEDRKGYTALTALDLFERQEIQPFISIELSELEKYYASHSADFIQTVQVKGRLIEFPDQEEAVRWMQTLPGAAEPSLAGVGEVALTRGQPPLGFEKFEQTLFDSPPGYTVGPVERHGKFCCLQKISDLERGPLSFEAAKPAIRSIYVRIAVERQEQQLARALMTKQQPRVYVEACDLKWLATMAGQSDER